MISETDESLLSSVFVSWHRKGIEEHEIYSIAKLMRQKMQRVNSKLGTLVDIVGTGGSNAKTFNVSTAAAFVVAGEGVAVAKHGNKAATSNSGSADVLSELGINHAVDPAVSERSLNEIGICFMFAPNHHRLSPTLAKVRRGLGFPTIFNCVGPLCNPASAQHQLIGVWHRDLVPKMANALARLGTKNSWIVHGSDGLDEITLSGPTYVADVDGTVVREFEISPTDLGFDPQSLVGLQVHDAVESASMIEKILGGFAKDEPAEKIVVANAASAVCLSGSFADLKDATKAATESLRSGKALAKLNALREMTTK
jgi:anthranilate phosphoribosyltransferase